MKPSNEKSIASKKDYIDLFRFILELYDAKQNKSRPPQITDIFKTDELQQFANNQLTPNAYKYLEQLINDVETKHSNSLNQEESKLFQDIKDLLDHRKQLDRLEKIMGEYAEERTRKGAKKEEIEAAQKKMQRAYDQFQFLINYCIASGRMTRDDAEHQHVLDRQRELSKQVYPDRSLTAQGRKGAQRMVSSFYDVLSSMSERSSAKKRKREEPERKEMLASMSKSPTTKRAKKAPLARKYAIEIRPKVRDAVPSQQESETQSPSLPFLEQGSSTTRTSSNALVRQSGDFTSAMIESSERRRGLSRSDLPEPALKTGKKAEHLRRQAMVEMSSMLGTNKLLPEEYKKKIRELKEQYEKFQIAYSRRDGAMNRLNTEWKRYEEFHQQQLALYQVGPEPKWNGKASSFQNFREQHEAWELRQRGYIDREKYNELAKKMDEIRERMPKNDAREIRRMEDDLKQLANEQTHRDVRDTFFALTRMRDDLSKRLSPKAYRALLEKDSDLKKIDNLVTLIEGQRKSQGDRWFSIDAYNVQTLLDTELAKALLAAPSELPSTGIHQPK